MVEETHQIKQELLIKVAAVAAVVILIKLVQMVVADL